MSNAVQGKVIVVTGASSGLGRAAAVEFARKGGKLVLAARRLAALEETARLCKAAGGEAALVVETDVTDEQAVNALAAKALGLTGSMPWSRASYDAVVVGSGPNGLATAIELSKAGLATLLLEAHDTAGGGARSQELTLPGFLHDVCSTVHPLGIGSPFFRSLKLERFGLTWLHSAAPVAHVLRDGSAVLLERSVDATAELLGDDGPAYRSLVEPFASRFEELAEMVLGGIRPPSSPFLFARFGLSGLRSMQGLSCSRFRGQRASALLGGIAAHGMLPLDAPGTASFGLLLAAAGHAVGWPLARGGSRSIVTALLECLAGLGGEVVTGFKVETLQELPPARAYLFDVAPTQLARIAGDRLSPGYRRSLLRFRHGPGVYKMDWALRGPIPWSDRACARAATVHLLGTADQVSAVSVSGASSVATC